MPRSAGYRARRDGVRRFGMLPGLSGLARQLVQERFAEEGVCKA